MFGDTPKAGVTVPGVTVAPVVTMPCCCTFCSPTTISGLPVIIRSSAAACCSCGSVMPAWIAAFRPLCTRVAGRSSSAIASPGKARSVKDAVVCPVP